MEALNGSLVDELEAPKQQWRLTPSPRKSGDSFSFDASIDSSPSSSAAATSATPKKLGILKQADTPGTGQSVRFGKRLYDDGDESRMSVSTANNSEIVRSTGSHSQSKDLSEDSVDMSLGFIRSGQTGTLQLQDNDSDVSDEDEAERRLTASPTLQQVLDQHMIPGGEASLGTIALPDLEEVGGYSNLEDVSFQPSGQSHVMPAATDKPEIPSIEGDFSFNESFLQAEMELAKKHMQEEENRRRDTSENFKRLLLEESVHSSDPTIVADAKSSTAVTTLDEQRSTPFGANTTHASEYMSTKSQFTAGSPFSTISKWATPNSELSAHESQKADLAASSSTDASSSIMNPTEDSPSVQKVNRRLSVGGAVTSKSLSLARLQSLTNTPSRASPLHNVIGSYPPSPWHTLKDATEAAARSLGERASVTPASDTSASLRISNTTAETQVTLYDVLQETNTLDSIHSERTEKLMCWAREAEEQSKIDRRMLLEERSKSERLMREVETANATIQAVKAEENRLEEQRRGKMQSLEELVARLHTQLEQKDAEQEEARQKALSTEEKIIESIVQSEGTSKEEVVELRTALEASQAECGELRRDIDAMTHSNERLESLLEAIKNEHHDEMEAKEAECKSLERELMGLKQARDQSNGTAENEKEALFKQLIQAQEEYSRTEALFARARKELEENGDEHKRLKEEIAAAKVEMQAATEAVEQRTNDLRILNESIARERTEMQATYQRSIDAATSQTMVLQRKLTELEEENDNLLQSLAELEDHRRMMEEDFLSKRDSALQESKAREEDALILAEEIQSRLEKVEEKLEKMSTRTTMLEHEVGDRGLQIVKLEKAKERLEEENFNYSIALSAKQQELSLLKRNGGKSLRNTPASTAKITTRPISSTKRVEISAARPSIATASTRRALAEVQETAPGDESGSSLAPLQSGPIDIKTMRRKTMDVDNTIRQTPASVATKAVSKPRDKTSTKEMPPPNLKASRVTRISNARQASPEEGTKVLGTSSQASSRASSRQSSIMTSPSSVEDIPNIHSRRSSASSNRTIQAKATLSASIVASEGPMDISELQVSRYEAPVQRRLRIEEQKRELQKVTVPALIVPSKRPDLIVIPA